MRILFIRQKTTGISRTQLHRLSKNQQEARQNHGKRRWSYFYESNQELQVESKIDSDFLKIQSTGALANVIFR